MQRKPLTYTGNACDSQWPMQTHTHIHTMMQHTEQPNSGIIICGMAVMIMPMLLFRYSFGICVSTDATLRFFGTFSHVAETIRSSLRATLFVANHHHFPDGVFRILLTNKTRRKPLFYANYDNFETSRFTIFLSKNRFHQWSIVGRIAFS